MASIGQSEIATDWPAAGLPLLWKQPIGGGYASFTTGEGRAYTIEQRRDKEAVTAYDIDTGRELWAFTYPADFEEVLGGPGPRATPVYHEGLVYSLGANGDFYCLSAKTGKPQWSKNILEDNEASNKHWAMAGSPLIVDDKVIVTPGGTNGKSIVGVRSPDRRAGVAFAQRSCRLYLADSRDARGETADRLAQRANGRSVSRWRMESCCGIFRIPRPWT